MTNTQVGSLLGQHLTLEPAVVELEGAVDGQGLPSYGDVFPIWVRATRTDSVAIAADGTQIKTSLTLLIPPGTVPMPREGSRITFEGEGFIGVEHKEIKRSNSNITHVKLKCRRE